MNYTPEQINALIELNQSACNHEETYLEPTDIVESHSDFAIVTYNEYCKKCNKHLAIEKQYYTFSHIITREENV